jgi:hypothetical protein
MSAVARKNANFTFVPTMTALEQLHVPPDGRRAGTVKGLRLVLKPIGVDDDDVRTEEFTGYIALNRFARCRPTGRVGGAEQPTGECGTISRLGCRVGATYTGSANTSSSDIEETTLCRQRATADGAARCRTM